MCPLKKLLLCIKRHVSKSTRKMNVTDIEKVRQATLAQLVIDENTPEVEKRREERRQNMVLEKHHENDRLNSQRKMWEPNNNQSSHVQSTTPGGRSYYPPNQYWLSPKDKLVLEFYEE